MTTSKKHFRQPLTRSSCTYDWVCSLAREPVPSLCGTWQQNEHPLWLSLQTFPLLVARPVQVLESSTETVWPRAWAHACLFLSIYFSTSLLPIEQEVLRVSGGAGATGSSMSWLSPRMVRGPRRAVPLYLSAELPSSLHSPACFPLCSRSASPPFSWLRNFPWLNWEKFFTCWGKLAATETPRQKSKKEYFPLRKSNRTPEQSKALQQFVTSWPLLQPGWSASMGRGEKTRQGTRFCLYCARQGCVCFSPASCWSPQCF